MHKETLTRKIGKKNRQPQLVAIVGGSGAGKTWLASRLSKSLGSLAGRVSLDDFYRDRSHLSPGRRATINFDHPRSIDWNHLERALADCAAGKSVQLPRYDFAAHARKGARGKFHPKPLILVDGLWLLRRRSVRKFFDFRIFIECPAPVRLSRRLDRDQKERGRTAGSVKQQFRSTVEPMHVKYVSPQARWANVVLPAACDDETVTALAKQLRQLVADGRSKI